MIKKWILGAALSTIHAGSAYACICVACAENDGADNFETSAFHPVLFAGRILNVRETTRRNTYISRLVDPRPPEGFEDELEVEFEVLETVKGFSEEKISVRMQSTWSSCPLVQYEVGKLYKIAARVRPSGVLEMRSCDQYCWAEDANFGLLVTETDDQSEIDEFRTIQIIVRED